MTHRFFFSDLLGTFIHADARFRVPLAGPGLGMPEMSHDIGLRAGRLILLLLLALVIATLIRVAQDRRFEAVRTIHTPEMVRLWPEAFR